MKSTLRLVLALALALGARAASATEEHHFGVDLSLHGGLDKYDSVGLRNGLQGLNLSDSSQLKDASQHVGATAILRLSALELGAIAEIGRPGKSDATTAIGALGGVGLDFASLRFEALAEAGGHRYGSVLKDSALVTHSSKDVWLAYVGLRPGLSYRPSGSAWILGVWAFARWDLSNKTIPVTLASDGSSAGDYKLGGSQYGAGLRLGFSL